MIKIYLTLLFICCCSLSPVISQCFDQIISNGRPVEASATLTGAAAQIVDGNPGSVWQSPLSEPHWIQVDLGIVHQLCAFILQWGESAYATEFEILLSEDGENWSLAESFSDNQTVEFLFDGITWSARYIRINALERSNPFEGFILREITAFGSIEAPWQQIDFPNLPDRLTSEGTITLQATATSGLPVSYSLLSGPAVIDGEALTFTGGSGTISIQAEQAGNASFHPAEPVVRQFEVIDPSEVFPEAIITSPSSQYDVIMPEIGRMVLGLRGKIERPEWFSITSAELELDGEPVELIVGADGHYYAYWTPESYGDHTLTAKVYSSNGNSATHTSNFSIIPSAEDISVRAFDHDEVIAFVNFSYAEHFELPSHLGAYDKITAHLSITCPSIGCDPWDRLAHVEVRKPNGEWVEIIRYITPYGVECTHSVDVTPYATLLQGKPEFRMSIGTYQQGWAFTLDLDYEAGTPPYRYSHVERLWYGYHPFGDLGNIQPADTFSVSFQPNVEKATLQLVGTGHGWGPNNTQNAAEFHDATHHILINNQAVFSHHNWTQCDPNPDGCQPQNGTWYFSRAGWCPGAISPFFEYDLSSYIPQVNLSLFYRMNQGYIDYCHPNNPLCNFETCANCNDGFNPHLVMASNLITYSDTPIEDNVLSSQANISGAPFSDLDFRVFPNPGNGKFSLELYQQVANCQITIFNATGQAIYNSLLTDVPIGQIQVMDISQEAPGFYWLMMATDKGYAAEKLILR
ncbi:MAG TPA: discoidin domain-containing protein [Saprospiraceae bacterium]|nr:discoidin domain-containing protein [Saprospiraceae bacterium]HMQ83844.1 discoidin domain-containing protein [Saprospiraceae bacterium]